MNLYLIRHAIAEPLIGSARTKDGSRALTKKGLEKLKVSARGLARLMPRPDLIVSSPLIRALDTANVIGEALGYRSTPKISKLLLPNGSAERLKSFILDRKGLSHVVLVGHEPCLTKLASTLLGTPDSAIKLKKCGACMIELGVTDHSAALRWLLTPKASRLLGKAYRAKGTKRTDSTKKKGRLSSQTPRLSSRSSHQR